MTDAEKVAAFIRERGITACPPAYAEGCACDAPIGNVIAFEFGFRVTGRERKLSQ